MQGALVALAGFSAIAGTLSWGTFVPQSRIWGSVFVRGRRDSKQVALTFDDGPTAPYTNEILDALARHGAKATFFILGENGQRHPELVRRTHDEGHDIGNHTWSHPHYGWLRGISYWRDEIRRTDTLIQQITGTKPRLFRAPLGLKTRLTLRAARAEGHTAIAWSKRSWDGLVTTPIKIMQKLWPTSAGDILLLHDGVAPNNRGRDPAATVQAIDFLIEMLRQRELAPVTVTQMLAGCD